MMKDEAPERNEESNTSEVGNRDSKGGARTPLSAAEIQEWLVSYLAKELGIDAREIDVETPFDNYGLSSASAVFMTSDLSEWLQKEIDPTLPYDYPTIAALARRLAEP